jgi:GNAT superfamily N-acetyltransferase
VVDAIAAGLISEAAQLTFEYMASTCAEVGWPIPQSPSALPESLQVEVVDLAQSYPPTGMFFVALRRGLPIGCVGLQVKTAVTAEVKRLYVRPEERGGIGRLLMESLHLHAHNAGLQRLLLDVVPSREHVIEFYRRLGYVETMPYTAEPIPMVYMERSTDTPV